MEALCGETVRLVHAQCCQHGTTTINPAATTRTGAIHKDLQPYLVNPQLATLEVWLDTCERYKQIFTASKSSILLLQEEILELSRQGWDLAVLLVYISSIIESFVLVLRA